MSVVARRYAKAIFALARDEKKLDEIGAELERLAELARDPITGAMLGHPLLSPPARQAVARTLADELGLSSTTRNFLGVLAAARRLDQLESIFDHYRRFVDEALGRVRAEIVSAAAVTPTQQNEIVATFERLTEKRVLATVRIDPALLGGLVVEVAGQVYDGSLRTQLARLAGAIAGRRSYL